MIYRHFLTTVIFVFLSASSLKTHSLEKSISEEWAKLSPKCVIENRSITVWIDVVTEANKRNELGNLIDRIFNDVDALFAKQLKPNAIQFDRYYKKTAVTE